MRAERLEVGGFRLDQTFAGLVAQPDGFGTDAQLDRLARQVGDQAFGHRNPRAHPKGQRPVFHPDIGHVHHRRTDELRHKQVGRAVVDLFRRCLLYTSRCV